MPGRRRVATDGAHFDRKRINKQLTPDRGWPCGKCAAPLERLCVNRGGLNLHSHGSDLFCGSGNFAVPVVEYEVFRSTPTPFNFLVLACLLAGPGRHRRHPYEHSTSTPTSRTNVKWCNAGCRVWCAVSCASPQGLPETGLYGGWPLYALTM